MSTHPRLSDRLERVRADQAAAYITRRPVPRLPFWQRIDPTLAAVIVIVAAGWLAVGVAALSRRWGL